MKATPVWRSVAALALLLTVLAAWWLHGAGPDITPSRRPAQPLPVASTSTGQTVPTAGLPRLPAALAVLQKEQKNSLLDTDVDGSLRVDAFGNVIADRDLRRLFDYFLERLGERPLHDLRGDLLAWLQERHDIGESARIQTMALFDRYVRTLQQAMTLARSSDLLGDLRRQANLRRDLLGADLAQAWFGEEESFAEQTLQRLATQRGVAPADAATASMTGGTDVSRDSAQQVARAEASDFQLAVEQSELLARNGAGAVTRHDERAALWGEVAADRLGELDRAESDWSSRLAAYARARAALLADASLSAPLREQRLLALLRGFSEPERRRVLALSAAGLLPSG